MGNCPSESILCPLFSSYYVLDEMRLPSFGADPESVTFSGISSGSFMAHSMHIIYSKTIKGVGLIAGGPYGANLFDLKNT